MQIGAMYLLAYSNSISTSPSRCLSVLNLSDRPAIQTRQRDSGTNSAWIPSEQNTSVCRRLRRKYPCTKKAAWETQAALIRSKTELQSVSLSHREAAEWFGVNLAQGVGSAARAGWLVTDITGRTVN